MVLCSADVHGRVTRQNDISVSHEQRGLPTEPVQSDTTGLHVHSYTSISFLPPTSAADAADTVTFSTTISSRSKLRSLWSGSNATILSSVSQAVGNKW